MLSTEDTALANITFQKNHIRFKLTGGADCTFTTRLLQGEFYQYKKTVSAKYTTSMIIRVAELIEALERAAILASSPSNLAVTLEVDAKERELHIGLSSSKGNFADIVDINEISGEDVRIGFNINFLLDALKAVPDDLCEIRLNGNLSPVALVPIGGDAYTHIVLPVRLKN
jgi:DNA polymerase-3 subunit beta